MSAATKKSTAKTKARESAARESTVKESTAERVSAKKAPVKKASLTKAARLATRSRAAAAKAATKSGASPRPAKKAMLAPPPAEQRAISESTRQMVAAAAAACEEKKAEDTRILELDASDAGFTDFFLITSGANERQTQAIADEVELRLKHDFGQYANSVEGKRQGEWILLDYVDFVVHIFLAEKRAFYDIERLRKFARTVDAKDLHEALKRKTTAVRRRVTAGIERPKSTKGTSKEVE